MTNEQLAVLLSSYAARLEAILDDAESALPAEVARAGEWWHGGKKVSAMEWMSISLCGDEKREELESKGYELRPTGCVLALNEVREFISDLLGDASRLSVDAPCLSADARSKLSKIKHGYGTS